MCHGTVATLSGSRVALTGKVSIDGARTLRDEVETALRAAGARVVPHASRYLNLVVHGDLSGQNVVNEWESMSRKLERVRSEAARGHHICVVTSRGMSDLLRGAPAVCQTRVRERLG